MKKSNILTFFSYIAMISFCVMLIFLRNTAAGNIASGKPSGMQNTGGQYVSEETSQNESSLSEEQSEPECQSELFYSDETSPENEQNNTAGENNIIEEEQTNQEENNTGSDITKPEDNSPGEPGDITISMNDTLFIGDSRTVGLSEYSGIDSADFFATVGMSVYNIHKKPVSVPNVGKLTLNELLSSKKYGKIYLMLGINEMGYDFDTTVAEYGKLIDFIRDKQPEAVIFVQANLHVTKSRSDTDNVINNPAINRFNDAISKFANGNDIFYLDANILFDDEGGNLSADKSQDNAHLYAKYYIDWGRWIMEQTALRLSEGNFDG